MKPPYRASMASNILTAARVVTARLKPILNQCNLNLSEFIILRALDYQDGTSLVEISKVGQRSSNQLSAAVKTLKKKGLVRGVVSSSDERVNHLFLTQAGRKVLKKMLKLRQQLYKGFGLNAEEVETLRRLTEKLIESDGRL